MDNIITKYKEVLHATQLRNEEWSKTKILIKYVLEQIKSSYILDWFVGQNEAYSNWQSIYLSMGNSPSGIQKLDAEVSSTIDSFKYNLKVGGALIFSQSVNGMVYINITYPYIDGIVLEKKAKQIGYYQPTQINSDLIHNCVTDFLTEMIEWEKIVEIIPRQRIGFIKD